MAARKTNVQTDYPDNRDWIYRPALIRLDPECPPYTDVDILNQHNEGACTGFAIAAAVNLLNQSGRVPQQVSERMLYEMAKRHDDWAGEDYEGSSLRGAMRGFKEMGVCEREMWPYLSAPGERGDLTIERARSARNNTLGAYYRLRPVVSEYHAAIMQVGVVVASTRYHAGWDNPTDGEIFKREPKGGGHAFAIIGYNKRGFWVQNSWGRRWGDNGLSLWTYEDWIENVMDAWVFRLALPTPQIFGMKPLSSLLINAPGEVEEATSKTSAPLRDTIAGHFVHVADGKFSEKGRYWSSAFDVKQTADFVAASGDYKHLLFYGHGGLNTPKDSAVRVAAMKQVFKANGIYPYHVMYDTGLVQELKDLLAGKSERAAQRVGGAADWLDRMVEHLIRTPGTLLWEEMKEDAQDAFSRSGAATKTFKTFFEALAAAPDSRKKQLHFVGHSTGAVLFAHMLKTLKSQDVLFSSCTLMAPACTIDLYHKAYLPILEEKHKMRIGQMTILNLKDQLEQDDIVGSSLAYRKSLLYLVSNAFEREPQSPLLGMEKFKSKLKSASNPPDIFYSNGVSGAKTRASTHGAFDNDVHTMNFLLRTVLGKAPKRPFKPKDLRY